jgi:hypothetical protein
MYSYSYSTATRCSGVYSTQLYDAGTYIMYSYNVFGYV